MFLSVDPQSRQAIFRAGTFSPLRLYICHVLPRTTVSTSDKPPAYPLQRGVAESVRFGLQHMVFANLMATLCVQALLRASRTTHASLPSLPGPTPGSLTMQAPTLFKLANSLASTSAPTNSQQNFWRGSGLASRLCSSTPEEHLLGTSDFAHVRLLICALQPEGRAIATQDLIHVLKSGSCLPWDDASHLCIVQDFVLPLECTTKKTKKSAIALNQAQSRMLVNPTSVPDIST